MQDLDDLVGEVLDGQKRVPIHEIWCASYGYGGTRTVAAVSAVWLPTPLIPFGAAFFFWLRQVSDAYQTPNGP